MSNLTGITEHEAAAILPAMSDAEFAALVDDIRENGLREPIVLHEGKILDGRHRWRACEQIGIEPTTVEWDGKGSPEAFVASMNLHRRHLTVGQRAMVAAKMATLKVGRPRAQDRDNENVVNATISVSQAAALLGVDRMQVHDAKVVLAQGTEEEIAAVNAGEASVTMLRRDIKAGMSPKERAAKRSPKSAERANEARAQTNQMRVQIYGQVRDGITALSTLPQPTDVVRIVKGIPNHTHKITAEIIRRARDWLMEFSDEWERQGAAGQAESADESARDRHADAGDGDGSAGAEQPEQAA